MAALPLKLLLVIIVLVAVGQFFYGFILDASPFRPYLFTPGYNASKSTVSGVYFIALTIISIIFYFVTLVVNVTLKLVTMSLWGQLLERNESITISNQTTAMDLCDNNPPNLGPIQANKTELKLDIVEKRFPEINWGGQYFPPNCTARHKVAIIVPYRKRQQQLPIFLNHIHPFLIKQQIEYGIFLIEQNDKKEFNRGKLMNIGFAEAQRLKAGGWQCFIFHDVDLLPLDTRNMYSCPSQPRHLSIAIDKWQHKVLYKNGFGGVSAVTVEQFTKANGYSNNYWGWGGEDDDLYYRLTGQKYRIISNNVSIARYVMLRHKGSAGNRKRWFLLSRTSKKEVMKVDGLTSLNYELLQIRKYHLYTHILVNIGERS